MERDGVKKGTKIVSGRQCVNYFCCLLVAIRGLEIGLSQVNTFLK